MWNIVFFFLNTRQIAKNIKIFKALKATIFFFGGGGGLLNQRWKDKKKLIAPRLSLVDLKMSKKTYYETNLSIWKETSNLKPNLSTFLIEQKRLKIDWLIEWLISVTLFWRTSFLRKHWGRPKTEKLYISRYKQKYSLGGNFLIVNDNYEI